ncbi:hypothetical protein N2152v2_005230 [Parachlorella kessleri]
METLPASHAEQAGHQVAPAYLAITPGGSLEATLGAAVAGAAVTEVSPKGQVEQQEVQQHTAAVLRKVLPGAQAPETESIQAGAALPGGWTEQQLLSSEPQPGMLHTSEGETLLCEANIKLKKVALMFLTTGPLPHAQLWEEWLGQVAGSLPASALATPGALCLKRCRSGRCTRDCGPAAACSPLCRAQLASQFAVPPNATALQRQHLFSIYVHAPPSWKRYPAGSLFDGTLLRRRVFTAWGSHTLMMAERRLLAAAVMDPANAWFVLLSETTLPLYPPQVLWQQLQHETRSRISACWGEHVMSQRYSRFMETPTFRAEHWRKSSQWFMLTRRHAEAVVADETVHLSFLRHCRTGYDRYTRAYRSCISDEHLIPSLLASLGEDRNTTCDWSGGTFIDWSEGGNHPRSFWAPDVSKGLLVGMRGDPQQCRAEPALQAAARSFVRLKDLAVAQEAACQRTLEVEGGDPFAATKLGEHCAMMTRKFVADSAPALLRLLHDCSQGLGVLPCSPGGLAAAGHGASAAQAALPGAAAAVPAAESGLS